MRLALLAAALAVACTDPPPAPADATSDAPADASPAVDATGDAGLDASVDAPVDAGPRRLAGLRCGAPVAWAEPLRDYLAAGEGAADGGTFLRAVQDLAVFEDRLYLGYGDANINLGRVTPIEFRAFVDDARPEATAEFRSDEEQLEQYRMLDGDLWLAGVDATEDNWLGNVYVRPRAGAPDGGRWAKRRTVPEGVHVHDVAWWRGALWAVGSGSAPADWMRGQIDGHLWRSDDRALTFAVAARQSNMGHGDARWVRLLALPDALLLFGYRTDAFGRTTVVNARWDGTATAPLAAADPLRAAFVLETLATPGGGLVRAAVSAGGALVHRAFRVGDDGAAAPIAHLAGRRVLDAFVHAPTGEVLVLSADGDDYRATPPAWSMHLDVTADLADFTEVASFERDAPMGAVAAWRSRVYFGTAAGDVWRCDLAP